MLTAEHSDYLPALRARYGAYAHTHPVAASTVGTPICRYASQMPPVTEHEIRTLVHREIASSAMQSDLIVDEFVTGERGRIDVAAIGENLVGYELKSDRDNLARLPRQMEAFEAVFDFCTLVVTPRHLTKARVALRRNWGLAVAIRDDVGGLEYRQIRKPRAIGRHDNVALAELLWRDELIHALETIGMLRGYKSSTRSVLAIRLAASTDRRELKRIVATKLTERRGWRVEKAPRSSVEKRPCANVSSRFLARRFPTQPHLSAYPQR